MKKILNFGLLLSLSLFLCSFSESPFPYDLHIYKIPSKGSKTMVLFHGMGGDYHIADHVHAVAHIDETLISFNFPDHNLPHGEIDAEKTSFGTIQEYLPALYVLKKVVVEERKNAIDLYGFSAGGGATVNVLMILNTAKYDADLQKIGVTPSDKKKILEAIQKGYVILDAPLKSLREIRSSREAINGLDIVAKRYETNQLEPIDNLEYLKGLPLNIIVFFQNPDEVLSNRDDALFIERLKASNKEGSTTAIIANDGSHSPPHLTLWKVYLEKTGSKPITKT